MSSGIYKIVGPKNFYYIGSTNNIERRKKEHFSKLKRDTHENIFMQRLYNKEPSGWEFILIEEVQPVKEMLEQIENRYLLEHFKKSGCMNINSSATHPPADASRTKEANIKRSLTMKGVAKSTEHCKNISAGKTGIALSEEHKAKLAKLPQAFKPGRVPWNRGIKESKETTEKRAAAIRRTYALRNSK